MLVDRHHPFFGMVVLKYPNGEDVRIVKSWDTETEEAEVYLQADDSILKIRVPSEHAFEYGLLYKTVKIPGAYLVYRKDGVRVTKEEVINGKRTSNIG